MQNLNSCQFTIDKTKKQNQKGLFLFLFLVQGKGVMQTFRLYEPGTYVYGN